VHKWANNPHKFQVKLKKYLKCNEVYPLGFCFLILIPLFFVKVTYASLIPDIQLENLPGISGLENVPQIGDMLKSNQDVRNPEKSESSEDEGKPQISFGNKTEFAALAVDEICESNFCVKEGEPVIIPVRCEGIDPNTIVTCIMTIGPRGAEFTSGAGNPTRGIFYFLPMKAGFYEASFQTKVLYCPPYLMACFNSPINTAHIQVKPDCGNKQFEFYNGDIDLLPFPRPGNILKDLSAVESWYLATYKDILTDKKSGEIFWAGTISDPPELKGNLSEQNTIDCNSQLIIDINIVFPGNPQGQLNPSETRVWDQFRLALANHEMGHVKIIQEGYYGNYDGKWEHKGGFNGIMQKIFGLTPERALEEISIRENQTQQAHDKYDADTLHGAIADPKYSPFGPTKLIYPVK
jgi:hypothetical protein